MSHGIFDDALVGHTAKVTVSRREIWSHYKARFCFWHFDKHLGFRFPAVAVTALCEMNTANTQHKVQCQTSTCTSLTLSPKTIFLQYPPETPQHTCFVIQGV